MKTQTYKVIFLVFAISTLWYSCESKKQETWSISLSEQQLVEMLADIHIAEGIYRYKEQFSNEIVDDSLEEVYGMIYAEYGVDKTELELILNQLANNPLTMKRVFGKVEKRISNLEKQMN